MTTEPALPPAAPRPEVRAPAGRVRGRWDAGVAVFLGMPFAAPPVAELRFAPPQRVTPWDEVRDAVSYGPPPPQAPFTGADSREWGARDGDWLTLNVWSPEPRHDAGLPVMVWIHGGAYSIGASSLPEYDGRRLAGDGGVVLVTFNYRVGLEGFGHLEGAPDNRGLLDAVAALEWVQGNIRAFGGDADRVTIFGQSAGAGLVAALLAMPRAAGLFRRAIAQSMPGTFFSPDLAADIASVCAAEIGLRATAADLTAVPPATLSAAGDAVGARMSKWIDRWGPAAYRSIPFSPVVDGVVLPSTPWQAMADGAARDVALIAGHTRDEHRLLSALDGRLGQVTDGEAERALAILAPRPDGPRRYREGFPAAGPDEIHELVNSDWLFRMPTLHLAGAHAASGGRSYVYELTWPAPGMGGILGACHGLDVPLAFGNLDRGLPALLIGDLPNPDAETLSARMRAAWTAFAATGDPGWTPYDTEQRLVQRFDATPTVTPYLEETSRRIWQDHTFPVLLPLVGTATSDP